MVARLPRMSNTDAMCGMQIDIANVEKNQTVVKKYRRRISVQVLVSFSGKKSCHKESAANLKKVISATLSH